MLATLQNALANILLEAASSAKLVYTAVIAVKVVAIATQVEILHAAAQRIHAEDVAAVASMVYRDAAASDSLLSCPISVIFSGLVRVMVVCGDCIWRHIINVGYVLVLEDLVMVVIGAIRGDILF